MLPCVLLLLASIIPAGAQPGLVAFLPLDEGQGVVAADISGYGHKGRLSRAEWVEGVLGTALRFADPGASVRIGRRPGLNLGTQITIEAWVFPDASDEVSRVILAKNDEYLLRIDKGPEGGRLSFFVQVGSPGVTWEPRVSSRAPLTQGQWHHIAVVWDGSELRMYLNGQLEAKRERTGLPNPNPYPIIIGNFEYPSCHGANFGGCIDEVRIYSRALTEGEVLGRYRLAMPDGSN